MVTTQAQHTKNKQVTLRIEDIGVEDCHKEKYKKVILEKWHLHREQKSKELIRYISL